MRRRLAAALVSLPFLVAACSSDSHRTAGLPPAHGPAGVVRVALAHIRWPLDPAFVEGRDETNLARALFATPLRTDPFTGALRPGLCWSWAHAPDYRVWRFACRKSAGIAAEVRRVSQLRYSPARWLFARIEKIDIRGGRTLVVHLRSPWRRFPYALTVPAAAPRGVPGPFRVVRASPRRIVARRQGVTLVFRRLEPPAAAQAFLRGEVDEAPVPAGDLRAAFADARLHPAVRIRPLLGVDLVGFELRRGPLAGRPELRRAYWQTADRFGFEALVQEYSSRSAAGLYDQPGRPDRRNWTLIRRGARSSLRKIPHVHVPVTVSSDPDLAYAADELVAEWRETGLGPTLRPTGRFLPRVVDGLAGAWFRRLIAAYPQPEALLAAVLLPSDGQNPWRAARSDAGMLIQRALGAGDQGTWLERADRALERSAALVPVAWVPDARLVSPRLAGWHESQLGDVDYTAVRARPRAPSRSRSR